MTASANIPENGDFDNDDDDDDGIVIVNQSVRRCRRRQCDNAL